MDFNNLLKLIFGRISKTSNNITITTSTAETDLLAAGGTGVFNDIYMLIISNTSATDCAVAIKDAAAGTTRFTINVKAGDTRGFALPSQDARKQAAANNKWTATCSASVTSIEIAVLAVQRTG